MGLVMKRKNSLETNENAEVMSINDDYSILEKNEVKIT